MDFEIIKIIDGRRYRLLRREWTAIVAESFAAAYKIPLENAESILIDFSAGLNGDEFEELVEWHLEYYIEERIQQYRVDD